MSPKDTSDDSTDHSWGQPVIFAKVDTTLLNHPKAVAAGSALYLWLFGVLLCRDQGLNGVLPRSILVRCHWSTRKKNATALDRLVASGLVTIDTETDYVHFWNYLKKNDSSDRISQRIELARARKERWKNAHGTRSEVQKGTRSLDDSERVPISSGTQRWNAQPEPEPEPEPELKIRSGSSGDLKPTPHSGSLAGGPSDQSGALKDNVGQVNGTAGPALVNGHRPLPPSEAPLMGSFWLETWNRTSSECAGTRVCEPPTSIRILERTIAAHCKTRSNIDGWLADGVRAFYQAIPESRRQFWSYMTPTAFEKWINAGKPIESETARQG